MAYPDWIGNIEAINDMYDDLKIDPDDFLINIVNYVCFRRKSTAKLLFKKTESREAWPLSFPPIIVNAMYTYSRNQILFPVGILQPPFYAEGQPSALNFGHLGAFIGHELVHAVDSTGRLYNMEGKQESWWPRHLEDVFLFKSKCFVEQYATATNASSIEYGSVMITATSLSNTQLTLSISSIHDRQRRYLGTF